MNIFKWLISDNNETEGQGLWNSAHNSEVARIWHNPCSISIAPEWKILGKKLRDSTKSRRVSTIMKEQHASGKELSHGIFHIESYKLTVTACLEQLKNGGTLKHAMIRIPNNNLTEGMSQVFARIALAIDPLEPPFTTVCNDGACTYYNLYWPTDWLQADKDFSFQAFPMWEPPIRIEPQQKIVLWPEFDKKMIAAGLYETYAAIILGVGLVSIVLAYLDLQKSRDLILLQGALQGLFGYCIPLTLGKAFIATLSQLIRHRLGPCKTCGRVVCKDYTEDPTPAPSWSFEESRLGRLTKTVSIWPISTDCLFALFTYTCVQCHHDIQEEAFLRGLDAKTQLPMIEAFMQPFTDFIAKK